MNLYFKLLAIVTALLVSSCINKEPKIEMTSGAGGKTIVITDKGERTVLTVPTELYNRGIDFESTPTKIAFGSCADQDKPQPLWTVIDKNEPDLFLFMGDNVYAKLPEQKPISEQYKKLNAIPEFADFRKKVPIMAIWDNNDYGSQDLGFNNPDKELARKDFIIQWPYVKDAISIGQQGIYHSKIIGGETKGKKKRKKMVGPQVQVIMLDTRWDRSPLKYAENPTNPLHIYDSWPADDKEHNMLSNEQWEWFEEQLNKKADFRIIVSSVQLIANEHHFQKWGNFPSEREKFFNLIKKTKASNVLVLSGDRHLGAMAKADLKNWGTLYDVTASSINKNKDYTETDPSYLFPVISTENFGLITFDWKKRTALVELRDGNNNVKSELKLQMK